MATTHEDPLTSFIRVISPGESRSCTPDSDEESSDLNVLRQGGPSSDSLAMDTSRSMDYSVGNSATVSEALVPKPQTYSSSTKNGPLPPQNSGRVDRKLESGASATSVQSNASTLVPQATANVDDSEEEDVFKFTPSTFQNMTKEIVLDLAERLADMAVKTDAKFTKELNQKLSNDMRCLYSSVVPQISFHDYCKRLLQHAHCSLESHGLAFLYLLRLQDAGKLLLTDKSLHRPYLACLVLAIKFHDDRFYTQDFYSQCGGVQKQELGRMEFQIWKLMDFNCIGFGLPLPKKPKTKTGHAQNTSASAAPANGSPNARPVTNPLAVSPQSSTSTSSTASQASPPRGTLGKEGILSSAPTTESSGGGLLSAPSKQSDRLRTLSGDTRVR